MMSTSCERSRGYVLRNTRHPGLHRVRIHLVDEGALGVPRHPRHVERALASGATETSERLPQRVEVELAHPYPRTPRGYSTTIGSNGWSESME